MGKISTVIIYKFIKVVFKMLISKIPICIRNSVLRLIFSSSVCNRTYVLMLLVRLISRLLSDYFERN